MSGWPKLKLTDIPVWISSLMKAGNRFGHFPTLILIVLLGLIIHDRGRPSSQTPEHHRKVTKKNEIAEATSFGG